MVYSGILKKKSKILLCHCCEYILYVITNIILGGIPGAIINFISIISALLEYKKKLNIVAKIILCLVASILIIKFNNLGIIGYFPLISLIIYICVIDIKDVFTLKIFLLFLMVFWLLYDFHLKNYVSVVADLFTITTLIISMVQIKKSKKKRKK